MLRLRNLLKWLFIIYDPQMHIRGIVQWCTLTPHIRMPQITLKLSMLSKELASNHSGSICSKYFTIDLTVIEEIAITEQSSHLPSSMNSPPNNGMPLLVFDRLHFSKMVFGSSVNKYIFVAKMWTHCLLLHYDNLFWQNEHFKTWLTVLESCVRVFWWVNLELDLLRCSIRLISWVIYRGTEATGLNCWR